ncbi:MAG: hypothetical protein IGQ45_07600 [Cyanobacterium sp. T60_A2020_053]|nr:hypothetical protein [Cyanobacterium sp. T60_A2020_053]
MKVKLFRSLKSMYRQESISAFIFIFGAVDALMGGFSHHWTLLSFGVFIFLTGVMVRWLQEEKQKKIKNLNSPRRYLPSSAPPQPLPVLYRKRDYRP